MGIFRDTYDFSQYLIDFIQLSAFSFASAYNWSPNFEIIQISAHLSFTANAFLVTWAIAISIVLLFFLVVPAMEIAEVENEALSSFVWTVGISLLAGIAFIPIVQNFFQTMPCTGDKMSAIPQFDCLGPEHNTMIAFSVIGLLVLAIVAYAKADDLETWDSHDKNKRMRIRYGVRYYPTKYMLIRLCFIILAVFLSAYGLAMGLLSLVVPILAFFWHLWLMPYEDDRINYITCGKFLAQAWFFVCGLIAFGIDDPKDSTPGWLLVISLIFFIGGIGASFYRGTKFPERPGDDRTISARFWEANAEKIKGIFEARFTSDNICEFTLFKGDESLELWKPVYEEFQAALVDGEGGKTNEVPITELVVKGLRDDNITFSLKGWELLISVFENDKNITKLRIERETISLETCGFLVKHLKDNEVLEILDLYNNQIELETAKFLLTELLGLDSTKPAPKCKLKTINLAANLLAASDREILEPMVKDHACNVILS